MISLSTFKMQREKICFGLSMIELNEILSKSETILISGASGFIGFNFSRYVLENSNIKIYAYREGEVNKENNFRIAALNRYSNFFLADSKENVFSITCKISLVINFASYGVDSSQKNFNELLNGNISFALKMLDFARYFDSKFIHTATCYEYEDSTDLLTENHKLQPDSLYGSFKAATSIIIKESAKTLGVDFVILRLFGVYGPYESGKKLLPYLYSKLNFKEKAKLTAGIQIRDYTYVNDIVTAFLIAGFNKTNFVEYNICSGVGIRIKDFATKFCKINEYDESLLEFGKKDFSENTYPRMIGSNKRFFEEFGWKPKTKLSDGFLQVNNYFLKSGQNN
jgi:nucleoside-diphosphate-sugar epimerase